MLRRPGGARFARLGVVGAAKMTDPPEKPQPVFAGNIFTSAQVTIWKELLKNERGFQGEWEERWEIGRASCRERV